MDVPQPSDEQTLLLNRDPEATSQAYRDQTRIGAAGLAYVPPHVPFVAGRDRSADEGAAGTDETRFNPDDDECLWTGHVELEAGGQQQDRGNGAQASTDERMKSMNLANGSQWEWILSSDQSKNHL